MNAMPRLSRIFAFLLLLAGNAHAAADKVHWHSRWSPELLAQAQREHRYVLLDLEAVWCHWCHVMEAQTYSNPQVARLIGAHYLAVKVDQDSDPELSNRYGDWGWPATIVFAPDGSEIVKRRGFIAPQNMASLLQAIVDDPTPGPSVREDAAVTAAAEGALSPAQRAQLEQQFGALYDRANGGWGEGLRFVDAYALEWALHGAQRGDAAAEQMARQTLDGNLRLIDPVWGGVYQYSEKEDWSTPHFEKIMSFQADDLRLYAEAYARWHDPRYLAAAQAIHGYLARSLKGPDGAFYVSQDADLNVATSGHDYYALDESGRLKLGRPPVDRHVYARENGWAIVALCRYAEVSGVRSALDEAVRAAQWVRAQRALPGGGFRHDTQDRGGPYLGDTLAMGQGLLALYRATGERAWLEQATAALDFVERHFADAQGGYDTAPAATQAKGVFARPVRLYEENVALARLANLAWRYTADSRWQHMSQQALRYLAAPALLDSGRFLPGVLLADAESAQAPVHITVVGAKSDAAAQALHAAALRYASNYLRVDWWDRAEGPLPNPDIQYPAFPKAAAYACSEKACSSPVFDADKLGPTVERLRKAVAAQAPAG
jgi:uncharacterized protein YyaL (SSP411 family)